MFIAGMPGSLSLVERQPGKLVSITDARVRIPFPAPPPQIKLILRPPFTTRLNRWQVAPIRQLHITEIHTHNRFMYVMRQTTLMHLNNNPDWLTRQDALHINPRLRITQKNLNKQRGAEANTGKPNHPPKTSRCKLYILEEIK